MVLTPLGNGVYNRDGVIVDYNGKRGHHPTGCNCVVHTLKAAKQMNPLQISPIGVIPVTNEQALTFEQWQEQQVQQQAYQAYMAANPAPPNAIPAIPNPVPNPVVQTPPVVVNPVAQIPAPVVAPLVPEFVAGQNEYVIPINIDLAGKETAMAKVTDARQHAIQQFTNGIHDFRFPKGYASRAIVSVGVWELVLRRKA